MARVQLSSKYHQSALFVQYFLFGTVKIPKFVIPERLQGAHPAAEVHSEQAEGAEAADSTRQEVLQRLPCPAPCTPDEGAHQRGEGGY